MEFTAALQPAPPWLGALALAAGVMMLVFSKHILALAKKSQQIRPQWLNRIYQWPNRIHPSVAKINAIADKIALHVFTLWLYTFAVLCIVSGLTVLFKR